MHMIRKRKEAFLASDETAPAISMEHTAVTALQSDRGCRLTEQSAHVEGQTGEDERETAAKQTGSFLLACTQTSDILLPFPVATI